MIERFHFYDQSALLHRLTSALKKRTQQVVFLLGAALSEPTKPGAPGVQGSEELIDQIRREFVDDSAQSLQFDRAIQSAGDKRYSAAFLFLQGRLGQATANEIVKCAVMRARLVQPGSEKPSFDIRTARDEELRSLEFDPSWSLNPGTASIGKLVAHYPEIFGRTLLTTNFDPLIEVAIHAANGQYFKTFLHADGDISQTEGPGCHVVHLHGYWYGSDTLHTNRQLQQSRPHLKASLASLLRNRLVVICGYGGWDDVFTEALMEVVRDDSASPEVLWCFHAKEPVVKGELADRIAPGVNRGRVSLYSEIDCNAFLPELYDIWLRLEPREELPASLPTNPVRIAAALQQQVENRTPTEKVLQGDDEDRPPLVEFCVGRDSELQQLNESRAAAVFITGIGGQGKSTLAAQYFADCQLAHKFSYFVWRDCKEESERFENQLASVVESLSGEKISGEDLAKQDAQSIVQLLMTLTADIDALFVFDNVDHYVNLETGRMNATPDLLIQAFLSSPLRSRIVLTCRPSVEYDHLSALSLHLEGLSIDATRILFSERGASCTDADISDAHQVTSGHAFWLDLLSIQVTKQSNTTLGQLTDTIRSGSGQLPEKTLNSIWKTLKEREQIVLRSMAEMVRPETENDIAEYLRHYLSYHKVIKALNALRAMNLIVVKRRPKSADLLELHPLVRQFVRRSFSRIERSSFIEEIIKAYARLMGIHKPQLQERASLTTLQYWTQTAELDIAAGKFNDAFRTLMEAAEAFELSGYNRELVRTVRLLLGSLDWVSDHGKFKHFDEIFRHHIGNLTDIGQHAEVDKLLEGYELTVANMDVRYILYCDMRCYSKWVRGDFTDAVKWGKKGQALRATSHVDTSYDVSHNLALSERDAGQPELALPYFLGGRKLTEVIDPEELDESRDGAHYGNIGRCLHFMGQIDSALVCYQKSAVLIEKDHKGQHIMNKGYIRRWIGELLIAKGQYRLAAIFLEAARLRWEEISPPRASEIVLLQQRFQDQLPKVPASEDDIERVYCDWILGRLVDAKIR